MAQQPTLTIYTGASYLDDVGAGGWAVIIKSGEVCLQRSGTERDTTNDGLELLAVIAGLMVLPTAGPLEIVTRNQRLARALAGQLAAWQRQGWRTSAGRPLRQAERWRRLAVLLQDRDVRCVLSSERGEPRLSERARRLAARAARTVGPPMGVQPSRPVPV